MTTVAKSTSESEKRKPGNLQAKIDAELFDRTQMLATKQRRYPRDVVEDALRQYLPAAEKAAGLQTS